MIAAILYIIVLGTLLLFGLQFALTRPIWVDEIFSFIIQLVVWVIHWFNET